MTMKRSNAGKLHIGLAMLTGAFCASSALGQWITLVKENDRLVGAASVTTNDPQEKDYSWGDVNNNGWIDLVVIRKQPFTSGGKRTNVLFMNEGGILVDRTAQYASAAAQDQIVTSPGWPAWNTTNTVAGVTYNYNNPPYNPDQGFLTPTNDRDSVLFDLTNNGWLDLVTATTLADGDPKHIGHPRVYANLTNDGSGNWQGFRFENDRIPAMGAWNGSLGRNPRFCSVDAGDVTGNGYADLYFGDYDSSGAGGLNQPAGADFNDKFLINQGASNPGYFNDETASRFASVIDIPGTANQPFPVSAFGAAVVIADINGNGHNDIVKQTSLTPPTYVGTAFNVDGDGVFKGQSYYQVAIQAAPYFVSAGDLNNNGRLDLVITDDNTDRFRLNLSTNTNGTVNWGPIVWLPEQNVGFGSNSVIVDLNNNGWNDIVIADVDVDIGPCSAGNNRRTNFYRNNQNAPNVTFTNGNSVLSSADRHGVYDIAAFDINGNGWTDLIFGRCSLTDVWMNVPQFLLTFSYPGGTPSIVDDGVATPIEVELTASGGSIVAGSAKVFTSVNGGAWESSDLTNVGGNLYSGSLPAVECGDEINYYFSAQIQTVTFTDPPNAPAGSFTAVSAADAVVVEDQDFDVTDGGYLVDSHPSLTQGAWQHGTPTGSLFIGQPAAPFGDASPSGNGMAWTTCLGGNASECNVVHGPTHLLSQTFDLSDGTAKVVYDRWFFCSTPNDPSRADFLRTYISNDGGETWVFVHETGGTGTPADWQTVSFVVSDFVTPTNNVVLRFTVEDEGADSITNAGIDNVSIEALVCDTPGTPCPADLTGSGTVGVPDLLELLGNWGSCPAPCPADLTGSGSVGVPDLLELLSAWGACPE